MRKILILFFFFFNDTATPEIYTLSLHDALPIYPRAQPPDRLDDPEPGPDSTLGVVLVRLGIDRKSTRLNSRHDQTSYAVFCLKKDYKPIPSVARFYDQGHWLYNTFNVVYGQHSS